MKRFMDNDFLLNSKTAKKLYHDYAEEMPIYDYHCHLDVKEIAGNKTYRNISEIWLGGDHYKWRAMRSNGVEEKYITGDASDKEKFLKWAETMPCCLENPLYHWTHLELRRYFKIYTLLSPSTADVIWEKCNEMLKSDEFSVREIIKRSNVKLVCTTDDPADSLECHIALAKEVNLGFKVLPALRPDKAIYIERDGFTGWLSRLGDAAGMEIRSFDDLKTALKARIDFFHEAGCRLSDHALDPVVYMEGSEDEVSNIFKKAIAGNTLTDMEIQKYKTNILLFLGREYAHRNWAMQFHIGTIRNVTKRMMRLLGPDTGFDASGDYIFAEALANILNALDETDELPRTILYCLNSKDNEVLGTIMGCFQGGGIPGKIQFGSGWWFNDQKDGMVKQMTTLANLGLLRRFVGMITDSRSFLSYTRHEYFRRVLCNMLGQWVENGEIPGDMKILGDMVRDICFYNAKNYFNMQLN